MAMEKGISTKIQAETFIPIERLPQGCSTILNITEPKMDLTSASVIAFGTDWNSDDSETNVVNKMLTVTLAALGTQVYSTVPYFEDNIPSEIKSHAEQVNVKLIGCKKRVGRAEVPDKSWITNYPRQYYKDSVWPKGKYGNFTHIIAYVPDTYLSGIDLKEEYEQLGLPCELVIVVCHLPPEGLSPEKVHLLKKADKVFSVGPLNFRMCNLPKHCFHKMLLPFRSVEDSGSDSGDGSPVMHDHALSILTVWPSCLSGYTNITGSLKYGLQVMSDALGKLCTSTFTEGHNSVSWIFLGVPHCVKDEIKEMIVKISKCKRIKVDIKSICVDIERYLSFSTLYLSPFLYVPFDMFCVQALLSSIPTLLFSTSGLGEFLGQRENTFISTCLVECEENYDKDVAVCQRALSGKISSSTVITQSFEMASNIRTALLSGTLLNARWEEFIEGFTIADAVLSNSGAEKQNIYISGGSVSNMQSTNNAESQNYNLRAEQQLQCQPNVTMNHNVHNMTSRVQTAQQQRSWQDVFDNRNLLQLSKDIGPSEWRVVGALLKFTSAQLDRFEMDNFGQRNAVFAMLDSYRNGSSKYGTQEQINELVSALEGADLMNLACNVRGTDQVTLPTQPAAAEVLRTPMQESRTTYVSHPVSMQPSDFNYGNVKVSLWEDEEKYQKLCNNSEIKSVLENVATPRDPKTENILKKSDCLVVFLMSHGQKDEIFGADGRTIKCELLFDMFREDYNRCPLLRGKPKLFFIQACRGGLIDPGGVGADEPGSVQFDGPETSDHFNIPKPETANMLVAYSSVEGYKSYRHTTVGSWFVCQICEVFSKYAKELHLLELLTKVTAGVADKMPANTTPMFDPKCNSVTSNIYKQCPETKFTLLKSLYFFPGKK